MSHQICALFGWAYLLSAGVIVLRVLCLSRRINIHDWDGHKGQFVGLSIGYTLQAIGAIAGIVSLSLGGMLLLFGVAGACVFDRRQIFWDGRKDNHAAH